MQGSSAGWANAHTYYTLYRVMQSDALDVDDADFLQGEGETKIMKRINHSTGSHIVVGNDSDIILMSLMCPVSQLYILSQETKGKSTKYNCISLDALNMRQSSDVLNAALSQVSVLCF